MQEICMLAPTESDWEMPSAPEKFKEIDSRLEKIAAQLAAFVSPPRWYSKAYTWAINHKGTALVLSITLCAVSIVGGGYFKYWLDHRNDGFNDAVDRRVQNTLNAPKGIAETLAEVKHTTEETNTTLKTLQPFIQEVINHQFENVAKLPAQVLLQRIPAVQNLVTAALDQKVKVDPNIIKSTGQTLVRASVQKPEAWNAAIQFLNYRSSENVYTGLTPLTSNLTLGYNEEFTYQVPWGWSAGRMESSSIGVPRAIAAQLQPIGNDANADKPTGTALVIIRGGAAELDGEQMRNVVFINTTIFYGGGPVLLKNVYFLNCTFKMNTNKNTRDLAVSFLDQKNATNFSGV